MIKSTYHWYAVYTRPRSEKKAFATLSDDGFEVYLPLRKSLRQWSDRKKWVELPLIPSYIFAKVSDKEYFKLLESPYVIRYITFKNVPAPIPEREINMLKLMMNELPANVELVSFKAAKGDLVEITGGPLKGAKGEVVYNRGKHHFLIRIEPIGYALQVEVMAEFLRKL
jgi:transcription antitermination factor NusG